MIHSLPGAAIALATLSLLPAPRPAVAGPFAGETLELTEEQRREIRETITGNIGRLMSEGVIDPPFETAILFEWPLRQAAGLSDPGFHYISSFVDQDPAPSHQSDHACGGRTYDGHKGTDFVAWPFPWLKMENDEVEVVAVAAGTIVFRRDGLYDKHCNCETSFSNQVAVRHSDGSVTWYLHLKNGSLTSKGIGAGVAAGEYLGVVGSSGCSSAPHLHLEVYDGGDNLIDPYEGPCNELNAESWWLDQPPYRDSAVNRIVIGADPPLTPPGCAAIEQPNESYSHEGGETIYFTTYFRDTVEGQAPTFSLITPGGTTYESWSYTFTGNMSTHVRQIHKVLPGISNGTWRFRVEFEGQTYERQFSMNAVGAGRLLPTLALGEPTLDGLPLTWDGSCNLEDTRYCVYVGYLGSWYGHGPSTCDLLDQSYSVPLHQVSGNRYYLVVPRRDTFEGSHGLDSSGAERPRGVLPCLNDQSVECP